MQEKGIEGKNKIKDRFNELSKQVSIDVSAFISALLKKKEMKKLNTSGTSASSQENSFSSDRNLDQAEESKLESLTLPENIEVGI